MTQQRITVTMAVVALVLALAAWAARDNLRVPPALAERGERLFPALTDVKAIGSLEVVEYDERTGTVVPFKVQNRNGRWTIPSEHEYPADAVARVAQVMANLSGLRKDDIASDSPADFEREGVLDPLDSTLPSVKGRGTRVTLRDARGTVTADLIIGRIVESRAQFRYVRRPDSNRTYISNVGNLQLSTAFSDWIQSDLLGVGNDEVNAISVRTYAVDRNEGSISTVGTILLEQTGRGGWRVNSIAADNAAVDALLTNLAGLRIVGVIPKPPAVADTLRRDAAQAQITSDDRRDLARRGFFLSPGGQLVSTRGEMVLRTARGLYYSLRIGELAPAGEVREKSDSAAQVHEHRYLFITVNFDPAAARTEAMRDEGMRAAAVLRERFAAWYYIVDADGLSNLLVGLDAIAKREP